MKTFYSDGKGYSGNSTAEAVNQMSQARAFASTNCTVKVTLDV